MRSRIDFPSEAQVKSSEIVRKLTHYCEHTIFLNTRSALEGQDGVQVSNPQVISSYGDRTANSTLASAPCVSFMVTVGHTPRLVKNLK